MLYLAVLFPFIIHFLPIENKELKTILSVSPAIYIILFRWGLGTDYFSYEYLYNNHDITSLASAMKSQSDVIEYGFRFLFYVFKSLNISFHMFSTTISLLIYLLLIKWLDDTELDTPILIMLFNGMFFVVWSLSALRQGLVLAFGTYLFLNKKFELSNWKSILIILLLAQFHSSAYFYILLIFIKEINLNRKLLLVIIGVSLISTMLPLELLLHQFEQYNFVSSIINYTNESFGFWDFPGLIRLVFTAFILFFYKTFSTNEYIKRLADITLIGFSTYYFLKISELVAGRLNIFTFILIIPLLVFFVNQYNNKKVLYITAMTGLLSFSMVYLQKDLMNHQNEVEKSSIDTIYKMKNINNISYSDYFDYDIRTSLLTYQKEHCNFLQESHSYIVRPTEYKGFWVQWDNERELFGIKNDQGKWEVKPQFKNKPLLEGNNIVDKSDNNSLKYYNFKSERIYLTEQELNEFSQQEKIIEDEILDFDYVSYDNYEKDLVDIFPNKEKVSYVKTLIYKEPFPYKQLMVTYDNLDYYFLLNSELQIYPHMTFKSSIKFNANNIAVGNTYCNDVILNSNGDIVWIEEDK